MFKRIKLFALLFFVLSPIFALAHQPRLVYLLSSSEERPFVISNPDVSQAFYGRLKGQPDFFLLSLSEEMNFYSGLLAPDTSGRAEGVSALAVELYSPSSKPAFDLDKDFSKWPKFYEEFAGDDYFKGPEREIVLKPGQYLIKVFNKDNVGKYVFVVGKKETFPVGEALNAGINLPRLKAEFFDKSGWAVFTEGKLKAFYYFLLPGVLLAFLLLFWILSKIFRLHARWRVIFFLAILFTVIFSILLFNF